jgi:predicted transcriptional regulator
VILKKIPLFLFLFFYNNKKWRFLNISYELHVLTSNLEVIKMVAKKERCVLTSVIETELEILKRHVDVLKTLRKNQPMGIIKLSEITNYPQHMVRYSLRILEQDGLVEPSPQGAVTTNEVEKTLNTLKNTLNNISITAEELKKSLD